MKVDVTELLMFFDELMPGTNEEQKVYWFKATREDLIEIIFVVSIYKESVGIIIENNNKISLSHLHLANCSEVRILDEKRKCLEIVHKKENGRCFLSLLGDSILSYTEAEQIKSRAS